MTKKILASMPKEIDKIRAHEHENISDDTTNTKTR